MKRRLGKRDEKPNNLNLPPLSKRLRRRRSPKENDDDDDDDFSHSDAKMSSSALDSSSAPSSLVMVSCLPSYCTVLELKSRLEMYGPISRTRIDADDGSTGFVTFRSHRSAEAAIAASLDPSFGIAIRSKKVIVTQASDPLPHWRTGIEASPPSRLLRAEIPLSRHGRSNKKLTATTTGSTQASDFPYKGREIVAYDDLL